MFKRKVVGHVLLPLSEIFYCFLKLHDCGISAIVIGKQMNRGAGDELEISIK